MALARWSCTDPRLTRCLGLTAARHRSGAVPVVGPDCSPWRSC
jgi:hypothetical protein